MFTESDTQFVARILLVLKKTRETLCGRHSKPRKKWNNQLRRLFAIVGKQAAQGEEEP